MDELGGKFGELGTFVDGMRVQLGIPGVAVGVLCEGREYRAGFGVTNVRHPLAVDENTLFQIGSITKTMTGTITMRLVEMGKLSLDAPVRTYLPDLRLPTEDVTERVTLRHLLTHVGGWTGDYFDDLGRGEDALARYVSAMAGLRQWTELGSHFSYNNSGFGLLGRVIEVVCGKPYETVARELLLDPLGMKMSFFFAEEVITHRFAVGHGMVDGETVVLTPWNLARTTSAVGGVISTVGDLLRYARFHMGDGRAEDGTRLLSQESLQQMQREEVQTSIFGDHVGLSWMLRRVGNVKVVTHSGGTHGQISLFLMVPERQFALAVFTNRGNGGMLTMRVMEWALDRFLGERDAEPEIVPLSAQELAAYAGRYAAPLNEWEITVQDDGLLMQQRPQGGFPMKDTPPPPVPPPFVVRCVGEDRFMVVEGKLKGTRCEALRDDKGRVAWMRIGSRLHERLA